MKKTPKERRVLERMAAGALCRDGFLGSDTRDLQDIIDADSAAVERLGLTHVAIAAALDRALQDAIGGFGAPVDVSDRLSAVYRESMGRIASPWPGEGVFPKGEMELTDRRTGRTSYVTPLAVHMIAAHGFYQGRGSRYRLDPIELADFLDFPSPSE